MRLYVAEVDLKKTNLHIRVSRGGPDPDGPGKWQTTLLEPTKIAAREGFDFVINGDFFRAHGVNDGEGTNAAFRADQWSLVEGPAMTDGQVWSTSDRPRPCLVVHTNQTLTIETMQSPTAGDWEVISGNTLLVKDGVDVAPPMNMRHPRTVVGLDGAANKLIILLVDGRKPGIAVGMSYEELAQEMLRLGCRQAVNLDGGGSSVMAVRDRATGKLKILNEPTDGRERSVANVLGITVDKP
jgi:exopolysaccharide biosynthesis protein